MLVIRRILQQPLHGAARLVARRLVEKGIPCVAINYGGWDTHDNESAEIGANLGDVFGSGGGLDTALTAIESLPAAAQPPSDQLVFYFASDFGRQLVAAALLEEVAAAVDGGVLTADLTWGRGTPATTTQAGDAVLEGAERPDEWVIRGNHHDAWVHGAADPVSGMVALMEEARAVGELARAHGCDHPTSHCASSKTASVRLQL